MTYTFATPNEVLIAYALVLAWGAFIVVVTIIALNAANKASPSEVPISTAIKIGCLAYVLLIIVAYRDNYGNFIEAEVNADQAKLSFAGLLSHSLTLKREQIKYIEFDTPGVSTPHSCYLKFIARSGEEYRSATMDGMDCKEFRNQIISLWQLD
jgi:hypothetical protein